MIFFEHVWTVVYIFQIYFYQINRYCQIILNSNLLFWSITKKIKQQKRLDETLKLINSLETLSWQKNC